MSFTESQEEVLVYCSFVFSLLSLISSGSVILYYLSFKELRKFAHGLVAWVAVADSIRCVGNLIGSPETGQLCEAQGLLKTFGGVASLSWVGCMAFSIRQISTQRTINSGSLLWKFHLVTWTVSLCSAILPLAYHEYVPVGGWCWISSHEEGILLRWTSFYGLLWLDITWIGFVYVSLWLSLKDLPLKERQPQVSRMVSRLYFYPLILVVCYGPASVRRIWDLFGTPPYWLAVLHICLSSLHGLMNAIAYGRNADVRVLNVKIMDKICGSCMGLRKVTYHDHTESVAIPFWNKKERTSKDRFSKPKVSFTDPGVTSSIVSSLRISKGRSPSRVSKGSSTTPGSSFLDSQSANIEMASTLERTPTPTLTPPREGKEKLNHNTEPRGDRVQGAFDTWTL